MNYDVIAFWSQIAAFVAFVVALLLVWKRILEPAVIAAKDASNRNVAEAERRRSDAVAALGALRDEIAGAEQSAVAIRERAASQAGREREAAIAEAREAGERQVRSADGELDRALASAREHLREEILERALRLARAEATTRVDASENAVLVDRFIAGLERR